VAQANFVNGYGPNNSPLEGKLAGLDQGRFCSWGRATFTTTATTCTIPARGGSARKPDMVLLTPGSASMTGLYYTVNTDGSVTVTRTDTTSGSEFSFLIVYSG
jgi:hypothetical protein